MSNVLINRHLVLKRPVAVLLTCGLLLGGLPVAAAEAGGGKKTTTTDTTTTDSTYAGDGRRN